jgi:hypothetical protein
MTCGFAKQFAARRALHPLKINPLHLGWSNDLPAFRAYRVERCQHLFEIDLPRSWHWLEVCVTTLTKCNT